jgi:hypothetical protein
MRPSWAFDAGTVVGASWTGIGSLSSSRPMSREDHSMRREMACRTNVGVVLETTDHRMVRDHVREDHLSAARRSTHRSHTYRSSTGCWQV